MVSKRKSLTSRPAAFGLVALVVSVFGVVGVASASAAAPEFVPETGSFVPPISFTSTSGALTWETTAGETISCKSGSGAGKIINSKETESALTFKGCATTLFGFPVACKTPGMGPEEIQTKLLKSHLYQVKGKSSVVDDLLPASGTTFAEFECAGNTVVWTGSVMGSFPAIGVFLHEAELVLKQTKGIQEFTQAEAEGGEVISAYLKVSKNGGTPVQMGLTATSKMTLEGTRKVKIT